VNELFDPRGFLPEPPGGWPGGHRRKETEDELARSLRIEREAKRALLQVFNYLFDQKGCSGQEALDVMEAAMKVLRRDVTNYLMGGGPPVSY